MKIATDWACLVNTPIAESDLENAWRMEGLSGLRRMRDVFEASPVQRKALDSAVALEFLRRKEPRSVVRSHKILGILPNPGGEGFKGSFKGIFGIDEPSAAQVGEYKALFQGNKLDSVPNTFAKQDLLAHLEHAPTDQLNILICHNSAEEESVEIALPSGDRIGLSELQDLAGAMHKNFVVICCYARESGIEQSITAKQALEIATRLTRKMDDLQTKYERGSLVINDKVPGYHVAEIMPWLKEEAGSSLRNRQIKRGVTIITVAGGGTTAIMLRLDRYPPNPSDRTVTELPLTTVEPR